MKQRIIRMLENERIITTTHWTVFSLGALSLSASLVATVVNVLAL